jgi:hypothetical protein
MVLSWKGLLTSNLMLFGTNKGHGSVYQISPSSEMHCLRFPGGKRIRTNPFDYRKVDSIRNTITLEM